MRVACALACRGYKQFAGSGVDLSYESAFTPVALCIVEKGEWPLACPNALKLL